jgi:hypothetical protein
MLDLPAFLVEGTRLGFANPPARCWFQGDQWPGALRMRRDQLESLSSWADASSAWGALITVSTPNVGEVPILCQLIRLADERVVGVMQDMSPWVGSGELEAWEYAEFLSEERRKVLARVARDLHEDVAQRLATIKLGLEQRAIVRDPAQCGELSELLGTVITDLRSITEDLVPIGGPALSMAASLRAICDRLSRVHRSDVDCLLENVQEFESLAPMLDVIWLLHRLLATLLTREAAPTAVRCRISNGELEVTIRHRRLEGITLAPQALLKGRLGGVLDGLRRAQRLGGSFALDDVDGLTVTFPIDVS